MPKVYFNKKAEETHTLNSILGKLRVSALQWAPKHTVCVENWSSCCGNPVHTSFYPQHGLTFLETVIYTKFSNHETWEEISDFDNIFSQNHKMIPNFPFLKSQICKTTKHLQGVLRIEGSMYRITTTAWPIFNAYCVFWSSLKSWNA